MISFGKKDRALRSDNVDRYLKEAQGLERDLIDEVFKSRAMAYSLAKIFGYLAVATMITFAVYIKKTSTPAAPVILKVNDQTGATEVLVASVSTESMGEVADGYWAQQYVIHRETYDYNTVSLDHRAVRLMSTPDAAADYMALYDGDKSMDKVLGDSAHDVVSIISTNTDSKNSIAVIRYTKQRVTRDGQKLPAEHRIATFGFRYVGSPLDAGDRQINPHGYQVLSWRSDAEVIRTGAGR